MKRPPVYKLTKREAKLVIACITNHITGVKLSELSQERHDSVIRLSDKIVKALERDERMK